MIFFFFFPCTPHKIIIFSVQLKYRYNNNNNNIPTDKRRCFTSNNNDRALLLSVPGNQTPAGPIGGQPKTVLCNKIFLQEAIQILTVEYDYFTKNYIF